MGHQHYTIIIPGIFRREGFVKRLQALTPDDKSQIEIFPVQWIGVDVYHQSYQMLHHLIGKRNRQGFTVSLIGTSAGASIARNLYNDPSLDVSRLITICGPVKNTNTLLFSIGQIISPTWSTSLSICSNTSIDKRPKHILTVIPTSDELVPLQIMHINNANQLPIQSKGHLNSITTATSTYADKIWSFLKGE